MVKRYSRVSEKEKIKREGERQSERHEPGVKRERREISRKKICSAIVCL